MERKMFGHRLKKRSDSEHVPGEPYGLSGSSSGESEDNPPGYEAREHVKYRDPGHTRHDIKEPEDEPHMKSHANLEEEHEGEDDYHMGIPDQTHHTLAAHIKRARMHMDAPDQQDTKPLRGNIVHNVGYSGEEDTSGEEMEGPNHMQHDSKSKEHRKKMIVAITRRKMQKHSKY